MKPVFVFALLALTIVSCTKESTPPTAFTLHNLTDSLAGTYTTTRYCMSGSDINGYSYDTAYHITLVVERQSDSVIVIEGNELTFAGEVAAHNYYYYKPGSGGGTHARWDSTGTQLTYGFWSGGLGGGGGCTHIGSK